MSKHLMMFQDRFRKVRKSQVGTGQEWSELERLRMAPFVPPKWWGVYGPSN